MMTRSNIPSPPSFCPCSEARGADKGYEPPTFTYPHPDHDLQPPVPTTASAGGGGSVVGGGGGSVVGGGGSIASAVRSLASVATTRLTAHASNGSHPHPPLLKKDLFEMFTGALTIDGGALLAKEPEKKNRTGFSLGFGNATSSSAQGGLQLAMGMRRTVAMEENLSTLAPFEEYHQVHLEPINTPPLPRSLYIQPTPTHHTSLVQARHPHTFLPTQQISSQ